MALYFVIWEHELYVDGLKGFWEALRYVILKYLFLFYPKLKCFLTYMILIPQYASQGPLPSSPNLETQLFSHCTAVKFCSNHIGQNTALWIHVTQTCPCTLITYFPIADCAHRSWSPSVSTSVSSPPLTFPWKSPYEAVSDCVLYTITHYLTSYPFIWRDFHLFFKFDALWIKPMFTVLSFL